MFLSTEMAQGYSSYIPSQPTTESVVRPNENI